MEWPGNRRRVQQLVDAHYEPLYRYAYRLSGSAADAEDLTQEAFCKAQLQFHQLRDPGRAKPWLFSILRNAYLHRLRPDAHHKSGVAGRGRRPARTGRRPAAGRRARPSSRRRSTSCRRCFGRR